MKSFRVTATLIAVSLVGALAAFLPAASQAAVRSLQKPTLVRPALEKLFTSLRTSSNNALPEPSQHSGCYQATNSWHAVQCASPSYIAAHIPHPVENLTGVGGRTVGSATAAPFTSGEVLADPLTGLAEIDTKYGPLAYSLQDNVFFIGSNGALDSVQFTDQTQGSDDKVCIWQIDVDTQSYSATCMLLPTSIYGNNIIAVEGVVAGPGLLGVSAMTDNGTIGGFIFASDTYGLEDGHRWNNNSGSILGYGDGSEAVFLPTDELIAVRSSSCLNDGGFLSYDVNCTGGSIEPDAYVGYQPSSLTLGADTEETNNLVPVIGSAPAHLPSLDYLNSDTAMILYGASTNGQCLAGSPPYCD